MKIYKEHYEAVKVANIINKCSNIVAIITSCDSGYIIKISK